MMLFRILRTFNILTGFFLLLFLLYSGYYGVAAILTVFSVLYFSRKFNRYFRDELHVELEFPNNYVFFGDWKDNLIFQIGLFVCLIFAFTVAVASFWLRAFS